MARSTTTKTPEAKPEVREPTFTLEALNKIVGEQVLAALAAQRAEFETALKVAREAAKPAKSDQSAKNAWAAQKAFTKAGFKDVKPNENIFTYNVWLSKGRKVKEGEHAVKVKNLRLFHFDQTRPATDAEIKDQKAKLAAKPAKRAQIIPINQPSA